MIQIPRIAARKLSIAGRALSSSTGLQQPEQPHNVVHETVSGRKRFFKHVGVAEAPGKAGLFNVLLDGRVLKSPAKGELLLPSREIATGIAAEWDAQTNAKVGIQPTSMPFMTLASTAIDQIAPDAAYTKHVCLSYLPTDTVLYFTTPEDRLLLKQQKQHFLPMLKWVNDAFAVDIQIGDETQAGGEGQGQGQFQDGQMQQSAGQAISGLSGMGKRLHSERTMRRMSELLDSMDPFTLSCLQCLTMECKSFLLALALLCRRVSHDEGTVISRLEEEFQIEIWGAVEGGHDLDRLHNRIRIASAVLFHEMLITTTDIPNVLPIYKK